MILISICDHKIRIIEIILKSIQYKNKELLLNLIKSELISSSGYLTELEIKVNPKKHYMGISNLTMQIKQIVQVMSLDKSG